MHGWRLEHSYLGLPGLFHARVSPTPVTCPRMVIFNRPLAAALGLDARALDSPEGAAVLAGNLLPDGSLPLAQAYAGHQFGHFTTLGDGRAILLGEQVTPGGERVDIQLKGSGPTPFSRRGDGRAALGPMLREFIISEAMHALGIPTTRSLAVVATGEPVYRERPLPGAVLTRVAASHLRVGTFEWAAGHRDVTALRALADYAIRRHYPEVGAAANPYLALLESIVERQAALVARWQLAGFIHGVLNTDNLALSGETIDYGPCAFMDTYDPETVFSSIDSQSRYSYGNQPAITQWNLARLAETMLAMLDEDQDRAVALATAALERFEARFRHHWLSGMRAKLGLFSEDADDEALIGGLLTWMQKRRADFTNTFHLLSTPEAMDVAAATDAEWLSWHHRWRVRLENQPQSAQEIAGLMQRNNPWIIPRNHKVEEALAAAGDADLQPLHRLLEALAAPYDYTRIDSDYSSPPEPSGRPYRTFCGT